MNAESVTLNIAGEEMPGAWAAGATYAITRANTPFLLIVAEREDAFLDAILYQKGGAGLLAQVKIPMQMMQCLTDKLTGAFMQQILLRQKHAPMRVNEVLRDFSALFRRSPEAQQLFQQLAGIVTADPNQLTFSGIQPVFRKLVQTCELEPVMYPQILRKRGIENTMMQLYAASLTEWNQLTALLRDFLRRQSVWLNEPNADLQIHFCGSIRKLAVLAEPSAVHKSTIQMNQNSRDMLYGMTMEMLRVPEKQTPWRMQMAIYAGDYEKMMLEGYHNFQARTAGAQNAETHPANVRVFHDTVLSLPAEFGIYAGSVQGRKLPVNGSLVQTSPLDGSLLIAPFSDAFSTLIAQGKVTVQNMQWTAEGDNLQFTVEFTHEGRSIRPAPRIYTPQDVCRVTTPPELILFRTPNTSGMHVRMENTTMQAALYGGIRRGKAVQAQAGMYRYYFKLYRDDAFLGQFDYLLAKGVSAGNE
ncbi:MAG: hypothetical protein IJN57_03105 [Oscillospiraceae bacterium]|nr:hypothetical protein [Oscillospiraceae bacterium]